MSNKIFISELQKKFQNRQVIPFIGAGLSMPYGVPDWATLIRECADAFGAADKDNGIYKMIIERNLKEYDYWEAVRIIKRYLGRTEEDIQQFVQKKIKSCIPKEINKIENNYSDLGHEGFELYFTTNYDHIIQKYIDTEYNGINLKDLKENLQELVYKPDAKRVFHLHGNISDVSSIVLSEEKYKELYSTEVYKKLFSLFSGTKTFLFLGFSFDDIFIRKIIQDNREFFKSKHYIILPNPDEKKVDELKKEYNIETISYNPDTSSHTEEIKKILKQVCSGGDSNKGDKGGQNSELILDTLPSKREKVELEESLFCRKLRLENIRESKVDVSKECFFTAEQYFRWLKKSGIKASEKIANYMISLAYMKYKEGMIEVYEESEDAEELWKYVHRGLKELNFNKISKSLNEENMPNEINKQGFIHVLADDRDSEHEVWWGGNRIADEAFN